MLPRVHHPFLLWEGCNRAAQSPYNIRLAQLLPKHIYSPCVVDWEVLNRMGHGEFDKVCGNDELRTKKIIKSRLCGRAFSWTLLEFAKSDEHFNAQEYWLSISREQKLSLSRSHTSIIRNLVLRNGYANVAWLIARWMKRKGADSQKESMICCGQFITRIARRKNLLSNEVLDSLSAPIYFTALDTTTLRELIDSEGRLILEDLYERMGSMEIRQGAIERMAYREPITHLDTINSSMSNIHHSSNSS
ncbi:hypothetical protein Tco_0925546 [Tanacetum coccineum]|uniref:Uncharacterized protein n=1 Tax=Tanacetum coccineum TaxID=301880 RepID=A0ABQ5D841_9ASTR